MRRSFYVIRVRDVAISVWHSAIQYIEYCYMRLGQAAQMKYCLGERKNPSREANSANLCLGRGGGGRGILKVSFLAFRQIKTDFLLYTTVRPSRAQ